MTLRLTPAGLVGFGRRIPVSLGRGGITAAKREGDGATPAGTWGIVGTFYRPDRLPAPAPWALPIQPRGIWCDDPGHRLYNQLARGPLAASHERLRRADPLYDVVLVTDWNWPEAIPGRGSAIFLHQWRRPGFPTAGCIAMARHDLLWLAARAVPGTGIIVPPLRAARFRRQGGSDARAV